jgi:formate hydrogenlyase transcriptional activator
LQSPLKELEAATESRPDDTLESIEREHIAGALRHSHGRLSGVNGAAESLGMKRTRLQSKLKRLGIDPRKYRG